MNETLLREQMWLQVCSRVRLCYSCVIGLFLVGIALSAGDAQKRDKVMWGQQDGMLIGTADGVSSFGLIGSIAAQDSMLAVADIADCTVLILDIRTLRPVRRIGRCGGGPGEVERIGPVAWVGDTLAVADGKVIDLFTQDGKYLRTLRPELGSHATSIRYVNSVDNRTLLISVGRLPSVVVRGAGKDAQDPFVVLVDAQSGASVGELWRDRDPRSLDNRIMNLRELPVCAARVGGGAVVARLGRWGFDGEIRFHDGRGRDTTRLLAGFRANPRGMKLSRERRSGSLIPVPFLSVTCGADAILFKWTDGMPTSWEGTGGYMELRDHSGRLLLSRRLERTDSAAFTSLTAAHENRFFFASNRVFPFPAIAVFNLSRP